jgi:hypothetical protein
VGPGTSWPLTTTAYATQSDKPFNAALCVLYATDETRQRPLYLRGNPDDAFNQFIPDNADANLWRSILTTQFFPALINGNYMIKFRPRPDGIITQYEVQSWTQSLLKPQTDVVVKGGIGVSAGDLVQFYKIKGAKPRPGLQRVVSIVVGDPATLLINYYTRPGFTYQDGGFAVVWEAEYGAILFANFERFVSHRTGRPFGLSLGKRPSNR